MLPQQLIQPRVERVTRGRQEIRRCHPHTRLSIAFPFAHRHAVFDVAGGLPSQGRGRSAEDK
jgi:hypothetical protein